MLTAIFLEKLCSKFHGIKTFLSLISPEVVNLCFLQSALRFFAFRLCAIFTFWWLEVVTHHLSQVSQHCIAYQMRGWSEGLEQAILFQVTVQSKKVSMFSCWAWVFWKFQLYRMLSSCILRTTPLILGLAVATWTNWWSIWSQCKVFGSMRLHQPTLSDNYRLLLHRLWNVLA